MAQTNVQAFSGDVAISSNLAVDTNTLFVDSVGNKVGIGNTSPATYLHLSAKNSDPGASEGDGIGTHTLTEYLRFTSTADSGDINSVSVGFKLGADDNSTATPDGRLDICANEGAGAGNTYGTVPDKTIATFLGSGNVGIGKTDPGSALDVVGDVAISSNLAVDTNTLFVDSVGNKVGIGTNSPHTKLNMKSGVFLAENQASTNNQVLYFDGAGTGAVNNQYHLKDAKFGTGIFVNDTGTTGSTISLMNKETADNTTKHASIGFVNTDTSGNGKFGGQIGFWPEDGNAINQQFRIYTSGTSGSGAGYILPVQQMVVTGDGNVGIGTTNPQTSLQIKDETDTTGTGDGFIAGLNDNSGNRKPTECLRLQGKYYAAGSGALLRFTNFHTSGSNPSNDEYNLGGIAAFDYASQWGGGLCFYTAPNTANGGDLTARMVIDSSGKVGIGTTDPKASLHVNGNKAIINGQSSVQTVNVNKTAGGNSGAQTRRYYRVYVPNGYNNFQIIFRGFGRNNGGGGDIQAWRRQYTIQRNSGGNINIAHNSGENIDATGFTFTTSQSGGVTGTIEVHFDVTFPAKPEGATYITFKADVIGDSGSFANTSGI